MQETCGCFANRLRPTGTPWRDGRIIHFYPERSSQALLDDVFRHVVRLEEMAMPVLMELVRIITSEVNDKQFIFLKEADGDRAFRIVIGEFEASSIRQRVNGFEPPRPMTHDLVINAVEDLGGVFQDVVITELKDHTYFARLRVRQDGDLIEIDARPSDAIAIAVTCNPTLPIYVNEEVLNEAMEA
jgi:uncharacterized protein